MQMFSIGNILNRKNILKYVYLMLLLASITFFTLSYTISVNNINVASGPSYGIYVNGKVYFIAQNANELEVIQGNRVVSNYSLPYFLGADPFKVAYGDGKFFIAYQKGPVIVWSNGSVLAKYFLPHIGKYPDIIFADGYAVVTASSGNEVYFISSSGKIINVSVMPFPQTLTYDNYTNVVYVGAYQSKLIYGISLSNFKIVYNFTINDTTIDTMTFVPPDALAVATYEQQIELINATTSKVIWAVSMPTTVSGAINGYSQIIYANGYLYVSIAHNGNQVAVISKNGTLVDLLSVGSVSPSSPNGIVYDPSNGMIYVMDYSANQISYLPAFSPTMPVKPHVSTTPLSTYYAIAGGAIAILVIVGVVVWLRRKK
ncbi:hypothetical protein SJAV_18470 [Sulfurisphaera javensis]|uniref:Uncharacterized protein n=1 Tax=Sulfurisphaera javensis TaxID=2049879 RepID=A0AAT9GSP8_9CREN